MFDCSFMGTNMTLCLNSFDYRAFHSEEEQGQCLSSILPKNSVSYVIFVDLNLSTKASCTTLDYILAQLI